MAGPAARLTPPMSEDKIIDLTIALESTLLFKTNGELQYRLALRGAKRSCMTGSRLMKV